MSRLCGQSSDPTTFFQSSSYKGKAMWIVDWGLGIGDSLHAQSGAPSVLQAARELKCKHGANKGVHGRERC